MRDQRIAEDLQHGHIVDGATRAPRTIWRLQGDLGDTHIIDPSQWRLRSLATLRPERLTAFSRMQNRHIYDALLSLTFTQQLGYPRMFSENGAYATLLAPAGAAAGDPTYDRKVSRVYARSVCPCIPLRARQTVYKLHAGAHGEHGWAPRNLGRGCPVCAALCTATGGAGANWSLEHAVLDCPLARQSGTTCLPRGRSISQVRLGWRDPSPVPSPSLVGKISLAPSSYGERC